MRALVVLLLLLSRAASADDIDPAAIHDLVVEYKRLAVESARAGGCGPARELAVKILGLDPAFHAAEVVGRHEQRTTVSLFSESF